MADISVAAIKDAVCAEFGITVDEMMSSRRPNRIVIPRMVAMYLCRWLTNEKLAQIAAEFGKQDHTTVYHAANERVPRLMEIDPEFALRVTALEARLGAPEPEEHY